jgi:hypothetical protein
VKTQHQKENEPLLTIVEKSQTESQNFLKKKVKVTFQTRNTIQNIVKPKPQLDRYVKNGVYKMKYLG